MKTYNFILTLILLAVFAEVNAQIPEKVKQIHLNMNDRGSAPDLESLKLKAGEYYGLHIDGVNLNLYKVTVNGSDSSMAKAIDFPTFGGFSLDALTSLVSGIGSLKASAAKAVSQMPKNKQFKFELFSHSDQPDTLLKLLNNTIPAGKTKVTTEEVISDQFNQWADSLKTYVNEIHGIKINIDELLLRAQLRVLQLEELNPPAATITDKEAIQSELLAIRNQLLKMQRHAVGLTKVHEVFVKQAPYKKEIEENKELKKHSTKLIAGFAALSKTATEAFESVNAEKTMGLLRSIQVHENNMNFSYTSLPIQYNGGKAKLDVSIVPRKLEYNLQSYKTSFQFPGESKRYWGVSAAFYVSGLHNEAYSTLSTTIITNTDTTTEYNIVNEDPAQMEFGVATLFTVGTKLAKSDCLGIHGVVGPGISIADKVKPRLLIGGGFSFGRIHMLHLNGGVNMGYVERKSAVYGIEDGPYSAEPSSTTVSDLGLSYFISLGYMFKL